jgi:hypothetical protein
LAEEAVSWFVVSNGSMNVKCERGIQAMIEKKDKWEWE